jgi:hypothetical protein
MRRLLFMFLSIGSMAACGDASDETSPDYELVGSKQPNEKEKKEDEAPKAPASPSSSTPSTPPAGSTAPPAAAPAAPKSMMSGWAGRLPATAPTPFGDAAGCRYTVTMKDVVLALTFQENKLTAARVESMMNELIIGSCPTPGIKPNKHAFILPAPMDASTLDAKPLVVTMKGDSAMAPNTVLTMTITKKGDSAMEVGLVWKRVDDQAPSYKWTVNASVGAEPI